MENGNPKSFKVNLFGIPKVEKYTDGQWKPIFEGNQNLLPFYLLLLSQKELTRSTLNERCTKSKEALSSADAFRKRMTRLRDLLKSEGITLHERSEGHTVYEHLSFEEFAVDVWQFDDIIAVEPKHSKDRLENARKALDLYVAPILQEYSENGVSSLRASYFHKACTLLEESYFTNEEIAGYLEKWFTASPQDEMVGRHLINLYDEYGNHEGCDRTYSALRKNATSKRLEEDYKAILEKRKNPTIIPRFNNIPAPFPQSLVDCSKDETAILDRLRFHRLVTIVGTGGVGKTRIAEIVARKQMPSMRSGAVWINLADLPVTTTNTEFEAVICESLEDSDVDTCLQNKHLLLVLDNAEHVLDIVTTFVKNALRRYADLRFLITSRQPLDINEEQSYILDPLPLPPAPAFVTLEDLHASKSVQLLLNRIPDDNFTLTVDNAFSVAKICHYSGGVPLVLELIATHIRRHSSLENLLRKLEGDGETLRRRSNSLDYEYNQASTPTLTGGLKPSNRHESLRKTIAWSFNAMAQETMMQLTSLSLFRSSFTENVVIALWESSTEQFDDVFLYSSASSLFQIRASSVESQVERYYFHESIRQYLHQQWDQVNAAKKREFENRYVAYYIDFSQNSLNKQKSIFLLERDNLLNALCIAIQHQEPTSVSSLVKSLWVLCKDYGGLPNLYKYLLSFKSFLETTKDFTSMKALGNVAYLLEEYPTALDCFQWCLQDALIRNNEEDIAGVQGSLGNVYTSQRKIEEAHICFVESIRLFKSQQNKVGVIRGLSNLGNLEHNTGNFHESIKYHREALSFAREINDLNLLNLCLNNLIYTLLVENSLNEACDILLECLEKYDDQCAPRNIVHTLTLLVALFIRKEMYISVVLFAVATDALRLYYHLPAPSTAEISLEDALLLGEKNIAREDYEQQYSKGKHLSENIVSLMQEGILHLRQYKNVTPTKNLNAKL
jgi:predicted ATPase